MKYITKKSILYPDYLASSVTDISIRVLQENNISHVVFDLDETLLVRQATAISKANILFIKKLQQAGLSVCIASNTLRDTNTIAKESGLDIFQPSKFSFKPRRNFYLRVLAQTAAKPEQVAMIGDRIINDIVGANRAGIKTVLVDAISRPQGRLHRLYLSQVLKKTDKKGQYDKNNN
jgi:HAD superfamily phosphatase (TIGR01668 family)